MATIKSFTATADYTISSGNESWRNRIDEGMEPPEVTGGMINLPQQGQRQSKAAVTGGRFEAGSEEATYAEENSRKIIDSILPGEIESVIDRMIDGSYDLKDLEFFLTNIVKSQYQIIAGEFSDNPDEALATQQVIDSLEVKLTISGIPTREEIIKAAEEAVIPLITNILGGGTS